MGQWLRIHFAMQAIWVWSLVWEDPTGRGTTKHMDHDDWACALESRNLNQWHPQIYSLSSATGKDTVISSPWAPLLYSSPRSLQPERKAHTARKTPHSQKKKKKKSPGLEDIRASSWALKEINRKPRKSDIQTGFWKMNRYKVNWKELG